MSIPMAPSSEIFIDDILKKSLIFKEKRLDLIGRNVLINIPEQFLVVLGMVFVSIRIY